METKSVVIKKPGKGLSRWMLLSDPLTKRSSGLVFKGHHPQFIFEIVPPNEDPNCLRVDYRGTTQHILVRKFFQDETDPSPKHLTEMLKWYSSVKARPTLREISQVKAD